MDEEGVKVVVIDDGATKRTRVIKFAVALVILLFLVLTWIVMAELIQSIQKQGDSYNKPYFLSYTVHSSYTIFLIVWFFFNIIRHQSNRERKTLRNLDASSQSQILSTLLPPSKITKFKSLFVKGMIFGVLSFIVVYTWYLSLQYTIVSINTAIYNSACAFVFLFSIVFLSQKRVQFSKTLLFKGVSVLICLGGIVFIMIASLVFEKDSNSHSSASPASEDAFHKILGYVLVLLSTILFALYEVLFKKYVETSHDHNHNKALGVVVNQAAEHEDVLIVKRKEEEKLGWRDEVENAVIFLGLVGLSTLLLTWPGIIVVDVIGIEKFEVPHKQAVIEILLQGLMDSVYNILLLVGILFSSPLFISVGSLLTIPVSVVADYLLHDKLLHGWSNFLGILLIIIGFLGLNLLELFGKKEDDEDEEE
eukprot:TRINITY_DN6584_c0_g1_i1.p1 TRINITY_DN6584_c0_g1~~TRINITY_DN6584_c0_g1_i1.p1  ORF type:complete len:421 (-),score=66.98 TRINITY_DN6584_c0_g1_i1:68-1330(-)